MQDSEEVVPRPYTITLSSDELRTMLLALNTRRSINVTQVPEGLDEDDEDRIGAECDIYETSIINVLEARLDALRWSHRFHRGVAP